jgi:Flp pilus assembly protein TadD
LLQFFGNDRKKLEKGRTLALKALQLRPDEPPVLDTVGWAYLKSGDTANALSYLTRAAASMTQDPSVNYHLGLALYKSGNQGKAKEYLKKAIQSKEAFEGKDDAARVLGSM